ncbi:MAG: class I SAM-dependent methyltransferase [Chloroflexi bacterium]|nr:class I SAM-dependent methyltransferase [Chloroflexota bacterium]
MSEIAVIHLVRFGNGTEPLKRFLDSYSENPGGIDHDLVILFKGFPPDSDELKGCKESLKAYTYREIHIDDSGFDIGAYLKAYKQLEHKYFCFLNSYSVLLDKEWLKKLYSHISKEGVGLVGTTGSYQSMYSALPEMHEPVKKNRKKSKGQSDGDRTVELYNLYFDPFPNYHIRTNAFMSRREVLDKIHCMDIKEKIDVYRMESGRDSITSQVIKMGQDTLVVGKDGQAYKKEEWHKSNTFWHNSMENLLVSDNQTDDYKSSDADRKQFLYKHAWLNPTEWPEYSYAEDNMPCPLCGSESAFLFKSSDFNSKVTSRTFFYYRCTCCSLVFMSPIPDNLCIFYPDNYYQIPSSVEVLAAGAQVHEKYKIDIVKKFADGGRLLEIGPATGGFLYFAKKAGFEAEAVEMDERCCRFISESLGIKTYKSSDAAEVLRNTTTLYDVIALWHVIEHLPDFMETLKEAVNHLAPGGVLVIAAPNPDSLQFKLFKKFWTHLDAPRHAYLIPSKLLEQQMESLNMKMELLTTTDSGGLFWNTFGWQYSIRNFLGNILGRKFSLKTGMKFGPFFEKLFSRHEKDEDGGTAYTAVFRKGPNG